jgi:hypothetical protein
VNAVLKDRSVAPEGGADMRCRKSTRPSTLAIVLMGIALLCAAPAAAKDKKDKGGKKEPADVFAATYVNTQNTGGSTTSFINIDEYSTDDEAKTYIQTLQDKGQMALFNSIAKLKKGWIRFGTSMGYSIAIARSRPTETGRTVFLVAAKPFQGVALMQGNKASDYPFSLVILTLDKENKGEGKIIGAASLAFKDGQLDIEQLGSEVLRLLDVREQR